MANDKAIDLLKRARQYLNYSGGIIATNAIFYTPDQAMRNAADEIEDKDALIGEIDEIIKQHENTR